MLLFGALCALGEVLRFLLPNHRATLEFGLRGRKMAGLRTLRAFTTHDYGLASREMSRLVHVFLSSHVVNTTR
jgi:hypothetical protein